MKKLFILALAAALFLVGCNKNDKGSTVPGNLAPVQNKEQVHQWTISPEQQPNIPLPALPGGEEVGGDDTQEPQKGNLEKLEILPGKQNQYLAHFGMTNGEKKSFIGKYQFIGAKAVGDVYILDGIGKLTVTANGFKLELLSKEELEVVAESTDPVDIDDALGDVVRTWKVDRTFLTVKGGAKLGGGVEYQGCDVNAIVEDLAKDGFKINFDKPGFKISKIYLSPYGTFAIDFVNGQVFAGDFQLSGSSFSYKLDVVDHDNPVISGNANGSIKMVKGKCNLEINGDFNDAASKAYSVSVKFILEEA